VGEGRGNRALRRALFVFLFAVAAATALRVFVVGLYRVSGPSMEPTLRGGEPRPDHVAAWLQTFRFRDPRRHELAVVERENVDAPIVKRVLGLPGERVLVDGGDVRVSRGDGPLFVTRKSLDEIHAVAVTVTEDDDLPALGESWDYEPARWERESPGFRFRGGDSASIRFLRVVRAEGSAPGMEGESAGDLILRVDVASLRTGARLGATLVENGTRFGFRATTGSEPTALLRDGEIQGGSDRSLPAERDFVLEFFNVDDRFGLVVDGVEWASLEYEVEASSSEPPARTNGASFEVAGPPASFRKLRLSRDLHYTKKGSFGTVRPHRIAPGYVFLLGDASAQSEDSRDWGELPVSSLRGRPFLVCLPLERFRRL
jgi:signal peptidase I